MLDLICSQYALGTLNKIPHRWKFVDPIEKYWEKHGGEIPLYPAGSDGTEEAMEMKLEHLNSVCSLPIVNELSSNIEEKA